MTSSAVRARVHAFEAMQTSNGSVAVSTSPPDLLESPISPTATTYTPILPSTSPASLHVLPPSPSPSPPILGRKTSLIDLKDWVVDDEPPVARKPPPPLGPKPPQRHVSDSVARKHSTPLISLDSPPKTRVAAAPPLPPRKASYSSLRSASASNASSTSLSRSPKPPPPPLPVAARSSSDSLTVDHTYPPLNKLGINIPSRHVPASSISSFHSVSLSSDGGTDLQTPGTNSTFSPHIATFPVDHDEHDLDHASVDHDTVSLSESFENLSMTSAISPTASSVSHEWEIYANIKREPPKLPQRPSKLPASAPTSPRHSPLLAPKRDGPPPPRSRPPSERSSLASTSAPSASNSDRSSIRSIATSRTSISTRSTTTPKPRLAQLMRPTPVPALARRRYESVFNGNVVAARQAIFTKSPPPNRKPRQAAGWRGLSVDLITNPEISSSAAPRTAGTLTETVQEEVGSEERLDGAIVKAVWKLSRLDNATLRMIWIECDPMAIGSLDRDGFVKGMWRIDEELRKAQVPKHTAPRLRVVQPKPVQPSRPILR
ncbi:uncharacterized protein BXZ73DRAFT_86051 [Epithele typhae]|uniref:uncharacterized protein n=1 Tax=Epithele typhae TaxID=378194 RepID=UPI00200730AC|nr:uncharacterized protein BXZ73DRAFT_86051 [Epithele typhae]KAH9945780.1 hypothetical protein BXZ73DRAFT_86051 [Epithele typhae]